MKIDNKTLVNHSINLIAFDILIMKIDNKI